MGWKALEPPPDDELSVFRTEGLQEVDVWKLGDMYATRSREGPPKAGAVFHVSVAQTHGLTVREDEKPPEPPRHAVVTDWPTVESQRMSVAQKLAADCRLKVRQRD